jgi:hypothetical protein
VVVWLSDAWFSGLVTYWLARVALVLQNPLVRQGRLTVEAFGVKKLEFGSIGALKAWYGVEVDGVCGVCDAGGVSKGRPRSARRGLQFDGENGFDEVNETTDVSSFAFCVDGHGGEEGDEDGDGDDVATSRGPVVEAGGEDSGKKKSRSPWSSLRLRRSTNQGSASPPTKCPPSTGSLPRLTIPPKSLSEEYDQVPLSPHTKEKEIGATSKVLPGALEPANRTYTYRTISAEFTNPHIPCVLAPVFKQRTPQSERLLKMYESGLPSWAMFLPSYGGYYRPWLRSATWLAFYFFSVISLTLGFYDLYKTLPGLQDALAKLVESYQISVWWPILSVYQWIESHAQLRLSILLTYLFGKSELLKMAVTYIFEPFRVVVMPIVWVLVAPLRLLYSLAGYIMYSPLTFAWSLASRVDMIQATRGNGARIGVISDAMRQSLVTAMRAANNVWKFVLNMSGGVSRHRMTLSRRAGRNWEMVRDAALAVLGRAFAALARLAGGAEKPQKGAVHGAPDGRHPNENDSLSFSNAFGQSSNEEEEVKSSFDARDLHD